MSLIQVPVSYGELIDKITILEIKSRQMTDPAKLANVRNELDQLNATWSAHPAAATDIADERARLLAVNETLWDIEDRIRLKEKAGLRPGVHRAGARGVFPQRRARGGEARDQPQARFAAGGREVVPGLQGWVKPLSRHSGAGRNPVATTLGCR